MHTFTTQTMSKIIDILQESLLNIKTHEMIKFKVINPDILYSHYSGTLYTINNKQYIYRSYKAWFDLAQLLHCKMLTPNKNSDNTVTIHYVKLNEDKSFHKQIQEKEKKYGIQSIFNEITKNEESGFIYYYKQALQNINLDTRFKILNLGVNRGDEFEPIIQMSQDFHSLKLYGIDYCVSAIDQAKKKFLNYSNIHFYTHNICDLHTLKLGKFDLIITIGTLQSSNFQFNTMLMNIVQLHLKTNGALILGFPNCRWIDGEMIYGAKVKNYPFSELGLLYKDVIFSKKYLQQKKFRVTITGKDYIFLTATSIRKN